MKARHRAAAFLILLVVALFALTGCQNSTPDKITLYETNVLKIEREGLQTYVHDIDSGADYVFTSHRVRTSHGDPAAQISEAKTTADTDAIRLQTVFNMIIVTDKTTGTTIYIK